MRKISTWAKNHASQSRFYIVMIKLSLTLMAVFTGKTFLDAGIQLSPVIAISATVTFIAACLFYPRKANVYFSKKQLYLARKSCDFTLTFTTFILISVLVNNGRYFIRETSSPVAASISTKTPSAEEILASLKYRDKSSLTHQEKRILKKEFEKQLKTYVKAKLAGDKDGAAKAILITLTIIGAIGLSLLLAGLACSLSCGGSDGLAILLVIVGLTGIIWGMVVVIKRISRGRHKKEPEAPPAL
jgi:hypothetical protein